MNSCCSCPVNIISVQEKASKELFQAEENFLFAHGWSKIKEDVWEPPDDYEGSKGHKTHGHAVNSQKYYMKKWLFI